jgi:hypothetical protein
MTSVPAVDAVRAWTMRQWLGAAVGAVIVALLVGLPTDVIPNPVFGRPISVTWWSYPVLAVTALLGGLLIGTYVQAHQPEAGSVDQPLDTGAERQAKTGGAAGLLSFFAVGCPVCNKIILLAVGTTGAQQWFEPLQPVLAVLSIGLLAYALWSRLSSVESCPVAVQSSTH